MNPIPQLVPMLKQLRLSGILDSLEQRNREAIEKKMAFSEFLAMLIQDEVARREQKKFGARLRKASFRGEKTLENFDFSHNPSVNRALITDLATCGFMNEKVNILIAGPCGTGKSHLAQSLGHAAVRLGHDVLFMTQAKLLGVIQSARGTGMYDKRFMQMSGVGLLIIDDFGLKPLEPRQAEDFHDLIAERYENRSTIVTSNLDFAEWGEAFGNRILGAATIDRLRHAAYRVVLEGESYRSPRPMPEMQSENLKCIGKKAK